MRVEGHYYGMWQTQGGGAFWQEKAGKLSLVELPFLGGETMTGLRDFDGDGRTDVIFGSRAIDYVSTCAAHHQVTEGIDFLAHAKAGGGFSTDYDVAKQWVREQCPNKPTTFTSRKDIACGLAYGLEASTIRDKVDGSCANPKATCPPPCEEGLEDALSMNVPPLLK